MDWMGNCYQRNTSIISKVIGNEIILIPTQHDAKDLEKVYIIRGSGVRIWELLNGKRPVRSIKDIITKEFRVKPQDAEGDLISFFKQLEDKKFVKIAHSKKER